MVPLHVVDWQSGTRVRTVEVSCPSVGSIEDQVQRLMLELPDTQTVDARAAYALVEGRVDGENAAPCATEALEANL